VIAAGTLLGIAAAPGRAQRVTGPWDDGSIAPRGVLRIGITPRFEQWKDRFDTGSDRVPLGSVLGDVGASFPFVGTLANDLTTIVGNSSVPLTFGSLQSRVDVTQIRTEIALDYGLTPRLGLQALIPYVKNRVHVLANPNGDGTLGFNPSLEFPAAQQQNDLVVGTITTAATTLTGELARCIGSSDATCAAINADRAGAMALVQQAEGVSTALASVYGTTTVTGARYAPVAGSALQAAVTNRLMALNTQFRAFLGAPSSGEWITGTPVGGPPIAAAGLAALLGDSAGALARPLGDYEHSHVGDIEVGAKFLLVDTFGPIAVSPLPHAGAVRLAVAGIYRLGTGQLDLPGDFTDVGTGDRQADLELRGFGDLAVGPRFWVSSVLRIGLQQPDRILRRIPGSTSDIFPEAAREVEVDRNLGDVMEFEVAPRYVPNDEFSVAGFYRYRNKGADSYTGTFNVTSADSTPLTLDASILNTGTAQKEQVLGFSVTFSTVRGYARGTSKWPLEVWYMHTAVMGGTSVPRMQMNGIGLRFYRTGRSSALKLPATTPSGNASRQPPTARGRGRG
jgi:hypothetical protein